MSGLEVMVDGEWVGRKEMERRKNLKLEEKLPIDIGTRVHWYDERQNGDHDATIAGKKYLFGAGYMYIIKIDNYEHGWSSICTCDITSDKPDLQYVYADTVAPK